MKWIGSESRQAWASVLSSAGSRAGPPDHGSRSVWERSASICRRSRGGISEITLDSAWTDVSSMPGVPPAAEDCRLDRDRDRLLVLEQQRRQLAAGAQLVAAGHPADRVDDVAELAEPVDVAAQRARADLEPVGQLAAGPVAVGLQQGEQPQHPGAGVHDPETRSDCGQELT